MKNFVNRATAFATPAASTRAVRWWALRSSALASGGLLLACALSGGAAAQTTTASADQAGQTVLQEVVVTARRRNENIEKVPTSITALGREQLQEKGVTTEADLQTAVPGLTVRESVSQNQLNYSIRGQTVDAYTSSSPGVLPYINDVQISSVSANTFFDMDSIQALKGPQGTLFGRNTTGGAVLFTTAKPSEEFGGDIVSRWGNYARKQIEGDINIPLIPEKLLLRLAGDFERSDGYIKNLYDGSSLGGTSSNSGRISLTIRPIPGLEDQLVFQDSSIGGTNIGGSIYSVNACGTPGLSSSTACYYDPSDPIFGAFLAAHPGAYPGGLTAYTALQQARGPYVVDFNSPSYFHSDNPFLTNTTNYQINDDLLFKNIVGWNHSNSHQSSDVDGTPYPIYVYGPNNNVLGTKIGVDQWSEEAQLQGKAFARNLNYIVGAYYSHEVQDFFIPEYVFDLTPLSPAPPTYTFDNSQTSNSEAAFAQGTYDLSSATGLNGLSVTGGVRYTWEQIRTIQLPQSLFYGAAALAKNFSDPSWTVGLEYQATPELLVYIAQRGSWRSGGFNANKFPATGLASTGGSEFLPETTKDVEIGAKYIGKLASRPVRLNVAAYNQWVDNVQRVVYVLIGGGPNAVTSNVPSAEITGVETDAEILLTDWLRVGGSAALTNARYTNPVVNLFGTTTTFGPYADTPRLTGSAFAQFYLPVPERLGQLSLRGEIYGQTRDFYSNLNSTINPGTEFPGYTLTNLRFDWSRIYGSGVDAALFVNNAFNQTTYVGGLALGSVLGLNTAIPGRPRMFGGELRYHF